MAKIWEDHGFRVFFRLEEAATELFQLQLSEPDTKVFAAETLRTEADISGKTSRVFLVCDWLDLLPVLRVDRDLRVIHEVPLNGPVFLVVDLDLDRSHYSKSCADDELVKVLWHAVSAFAKTLPEFGPDIRVAKSEADASSAQKFSRHVKFEFVKPNGDKFCFANLFCAGAFIRRCLANLWRVDKDSPLFFEHDGEMRCVVDTATFAKNHTMRCMGMHKILEPDRPLIFLVDGKTRVPEDTCIEGSANLMMQPPGLSLNATCVTLKEENGQDARSTNCTIFNYPRGLGSAFSNAFSRKLQAQSFLSSSGGNNAVRIALEKFVRSYNPDFKAGVSLRPNQTIFAPIQTVPIESRVDNILEYDPSLEQPFSLAFAIAQWAYHLTHDTSVSVKSETEDVEVSVLIKLDKTNACMFKKPDFLHRSNHSYLIVNVSRAKAFLRCHDDMCAKRVAEIELPPSLVFWMMFAVELRNSYRLAWSRSQTSSVPQVFTVYDVFEEVESRVDEPVCSTVFSYHQAPPWQKKMMEKVAAEGSFDTPVEKALKRALDFLMMTPVP